MMTPKALCESIFEEAFLSQNMRTRTTELTSQLYLFRI